MSKQINAWAVVVDKCITSKGVKKDYVISVCSTRQEAREEKADRGGKESGVRIVKLSGNQEVR